MRRVTTKYHLTFSITHTQSISINTNIFRELPPNNGRHFFRTLYEIILHLPSCYKIVLHFFSELNSQSYYQTIIHFLDFISKTILPFSEGFYKIMLHTFPEFISTNYWNYQETLTFSEFISTNTNIFRELLPNNGKDSFQSSNQTILTLSECTTK